MQPSLCGLFKKGKHTETKAHILQGRELQEAHAPQSDPVQEGQGVDILTGSSPLRSQAEGLRWSDQAHLQEEGQDHQEDCASYGVHCV